MVGVAFSGGVQPLPLRFDLNMVVTFAIDVETGCGALTRFYIGSNFRAIFEVR
jgi:hypothetical protein